MVQAPVEINVSTEKKKTDEELAEQAAKRKEQGKRLQKQAQENDWKISTEARRMGVFF